MKENPLNIGLLNYLPQVKKNQLGWPWVEETSPSLYNSRLSFPKISIVTPSYNQGEFIEETIRSILLQNYPNLEYIIIDGGSNDSTLKIIQKYDSWIKYWVSEADEGQSDAINKGFKMATGDIINWLNSDDFLTKGGLLKIAQSFIENPKADFVYGKCSRLTGDGILPMPFYSSPKHIRYLASFPYAQQSCFYKRKIFDRIGYLDEKLNITMDYDLFVRIALHYNFKSLNEFIAVFRMHEDQKTITYSKEWDENRIIVFSRLLRSIKIDLQLINSLKKNGWYQEGEQTYSISKEISDVDKNEIISIFLQDSISMLYQAKDFEQSYQIAKWLQSHFSASISRRTKNIYLKTIFFRYKLIYSIYTRFKTNA